MAEKMKAEKKNRVVEYLLSEHKLENYLLLFLGLFAIELGVILLQGKLLTIPEEAWLIGGKTNTIVFSWVLIGLGAISIVLVASSFYRPSFTENKTTFTTFHKNSFHFKPVMCLISVNEGR